MIKYPIEKWKIWITQQGIPLWTYGSFWVKIRYFTPQSTINIIWLVPHMRRCFKRIQSCEEHNSTPLQKKKKMVYQRGYSDSCDMTKRLGYSCAQKNCQLISIRFIHRKMFFRSQWEGLTIQSKVNVWIISGQSSLTTFQYHWK